MEFLDFLHLVNCLMLAGSIAALVGLIVYAVVHIAKHGI